MTNESNSLPWITPRRRADNPTSAEATAFGDRIPRKSPTETPSQPVQARTLGVTRLGEIAEREAEAPIPAEPKTSEPATSPWKSPQSFPWNYLIVALGLAGFFVGVVVLASRSRPVMIAPTAPVPATVHYHIASPAGTESSEVAMHGGEVENESSRVVPPALKSWSPVEDRLARREDLASSAEAPNNNNSMPLDAPPTRALPPGFDEPTASIVVPAETGRAPADTDSSATIRLDGKIQKFPKEP